MSINTMTTLAVARNLRAPTKADAGERPVDSNASEQAPSLPALLVKTVPTGLVTAYTAFVAVASEIANQPATSGGGSRDLIGIRWGAFVLLVLFAIGMTLASYKAKAEPNSRFPWIELGAVTVAATGWGLAMPESPLLAATEDGAQGALLVALIGFAAVGVNLVLASLMKKQA